MSNENIGHTDNEIDRRTRCNRDVSRATCGRRFFFAEFECAMLHFKCSVYLDETDVIVKNPTRFLDDNFSLQSLNVRVLSV